MKLNLRMVAVAAAMAAAGSAHADLISQGTGNSSLTLYAFNTSTLSFYVRDLGYRLNDFLPSSVTTLAGDGAAVGSLTPDAGITLNKTTNASFADSSFSSWLTAQTATDVRWSLFAGDALSTGANGVARLLLASSTDLSVTNQAVRNANATATGAAGLQTLAGAFTTSATGTFNAGNLSLSNGILNAASLSTLDAASSLYYFVATSQTGNTAVASTATKYGNSAGFATVLLASNGDFTYSLAPAAPSAVPIPAAAWLMGSGLMGLGGLIRRRKVAAKA